MVDGKEQQLKEWQDKMINDWLHKQKLVVFEDDAGNVYAPSITTTTTKTTQAPFQITSLVNVTTQAPHIDHVLTGSNAAQLIMVISITCFILIGLILLILIVIRWCRRSAIKKKEQISICRRLNTPEDEHIYAEIESLQDSASVEPCAGTASVEPYVGASETSGDVILPMKRTKNRRKDFLSCRAISTCIYKFFGSDIDSRIVSYNKSHHVATIEQQLPPNPPDRNTTKHERNRKKAVNRGESTTSRRPLLDRDSCLSSSLSSNIRTSTYNPLIKETKFAVSESYDSIVPIKTLDNNSAPGNTEFNISTDLDKNGVTGGHTEMTVPKSTILSQDITDTNLSLEENEKEEIPKNHEYFILESTQNQANIEIKNEVVLMPRKNNVNGGQMSGILNMNMSSPNNMNTKSVEIVDVANSAGFSPDSDPKLISPLKRTTNPVLNDLQSKTDEMEVTDSIDKGEDYELSKLTEAPSPPEIQNDDKYLTPVDVIRKPDFVDVFLSSPPRPTSLQPRTLTEKHNIPKFVSLKNEIPASLMKSMGPVGGLHVNPGISQTPNITSNESHNDDITAYNKHEKKKNAENVHTSLQSHSPTKASVGHKPVQTEV